MDFDVKRVYTAVNADELKVGTLVIFADSMGDLKRKINNAEEKDVFKERKNICAIQDIFSEDQERRFKANGVCWSLVYFISEPEEKVLKWTDLRIGDVIKHKKDGEYRMIVGLSTDHECEHVMVGGDWLSDEDLQQWEKVEDK